MSQWIDHWNAYWFPEATPVRLSICRIIVVAAQLFVFFPSLEGHALKFLHPGWSLIEPQAIIVALSSILPQDVFPTSTSLTAIYWGTVIAGISTLIGLCTRTSALFFASGCWILVAHKYSYGDLHHREAILCIFLMTLAFSPSGECFSVDALIRRFRGQRQQRGDWWLRKTTTAIWPLKLTQVLLALAYFENALSKLAFGGFAWMNGYTLQQSIFSDAVTWGQPLGLWLAQQHELCIILSIGVILFEFFFFLTLVLPRTIPVFLISGVLLHVGIYVAMGASFFEYIVLYVVFIDFERFVLVRLQQPVSQFPKSVLYGSTH